MSAILNRQQQEEINRWGRKGLMQYMMSFGAFMYSSQIAAKQLRCFSRPGDMFREALLEAMTCQVSHQTSKALLVFGGLRSVLVKRMFSSYTSSRIKQCLLKDLMARVVSQLHNFPEPRCVKTLTVSSKVYHCTVLSVAFHPTVPLLATGGDDKTVKLWRLSSDRSSATCVAVLSGHMGPVNSVAFHPTASLLATGSSDNTVKLWRLSSDNSSANCVATLEGCMSCAKMFGQQPSRQPMIVPKRTIQKIPNPLLEQYRVAPSCNADCKKGHRDIVYSVAFHPTAQFLATSSQDNTAKLWRLSSDNSSATCEATLAGHSNSVISVAFHPTARLLATGSSDNTIKLWRLSSDNLSATCVATLAGHMGPVISVAFHPTAPLLATGSKDKTTKLWRLSSDNLSATCVATLAGHSDSVLSVAFDPTGRCVATGSYDNTAKLWQLSSDNSSATCVATLEGPRSSVIYSVAFDPNAPLLATSVLAGSSVLTGRSEENYFELWR